MIVNGNYEILLTCELFISNSNIFAAPGGCGKSYLIQIIAQFVENILRQVGEDPLKPKVIKMAPTGIAASLIGMHILKRQYRGYKIIVSENF